MFLIFVAPSEIFDHQPIDSKVLKETSVIGVKTALQINEMKAILAIMDEVKNMVDYNVDTISNMKIYKKNVLRSFMFIIQKFFPNGDMDKLKARPVADGSQKVRHLYDFVSSATIS